MSRNDDTMTVEEVIAHIMRVRKVSHEVAETMLLEKLQAGKITAYRSSAPSKRGAPIVHASDCATNNGPALPPGPCDCGAQA